MTKKISDITPKVEQTVESTPKVEQTVESTPIEISELDKLKFENMKLKLDLLNKDYQIIQKNINDLSVMINESISEYNIKMNIPKGYRLDFSTMTFIKQ